MGTNMEAHPASVAEVLLKGQCVFYVGIQHFQNIVREMIMAAINNMSPTPAIQTITGK